MPEYIITLTVGVCCCFVVTCGRASGSEPSHMISSKHSLWAGLGEDERARDAGCSWCGSCSIVLIALHAGAGQDIVEVSDADAD